MGLFRITSTVFAREGKINEEQYEEDLLNEELTEEVEEYYDTRIEVKKIIGGISVLAKQRNLIVKE